jgi:hypothetical protein
LRNKNPTGYPFPLCSTLHTIPNCFYRHLQRSFHPERAFEALLQKDPSPLPTTPTLLCRHRRRHRPPHRQIHPRRLLDTQHGSTQPLGRLDLPNTVCCVRTRKDSRWCDLLEMADFRVPPARRGNLKEGGNCRLCPRDWYYSSPISSAGSPFVLSCSLSWGAVCVR